MKSYKLITIVALGCLIVFSTHAELAAIVFGQPKATLEKVATHIVLGKVQAIYSRKERKKIDGYSYDFTYYVAEVKVDKYEKGKGPSDLIYLRYFDVRYIRTGIPSKPQGRMGRPPVRKEHRFYVAHNKLDGFHPKAENNNGGHNVVYVQGTSPLQPFDVSDSPQVDVDLDEITPIGAPQGHRPRPVVGKNYRFYAARNASDSYSRTENNDGGYNVVYINGVQPLENRDQPDED